MGCAQDKVGQRQKASGKSIIFFMVAFSCRNRRVGF
jgi:hypothetical protein